MIPRRTLGRLQTSARFCVLIGIAWSLTALLSEVPCSGQEVFVSDQIKIASEDFDLATPTQIEVLEQRIDSLEQAASKQREQDKAAKAPPEQKKPTVEWAGQFQQDYYWFSQDAENQSQFGDIQDGSAFRRARFGMFGEYGQTDYRIEMDFALSGRPSFLDVFAGIKDVPVLGNIRFGHFFEPFSLDRITSNRFSTFMERSLIDQAFVPARNTGIASHHNFFDSRASFVTGVYRTDSDVYGDDAEDGFKESWTSRLTCLPWYESCGEELEYLHLGFAYSYRSTSQNQVRFRAQPEARLGAITNNNVPFFANTGNIDASDYQLIGTEIAWIHGPFSLQSEYVGVPVNGENGTLYFQGGYATASYFLTGESRPYNKRFGCFDRVMPKASWVGPKGSRLGSGPGAWEIAARISNLDLNDAYVAGGDITNFTVGLNWHLNPYLRWTSNYIHSLSDPSNIESTADIFGTRLGFEF